MTEPRLPEHVQTTSGALAQPRKSVVRVATLSDVALDWAVAKCQGYRIDNLQSFLIEQLKGGKRWHDSPAKAWPIIDGNGIATRRSKGLWYAMSEDDAGTLETVNWCAHTYKGGERYGKLSFQVKKRQKRFEGATSLIAGLRCYVAGIMGEEIEIPAELLQY